MITHDCVAGHPSALKKPLEISLAQYAKCCFFRSGDKCIARLIPHRSHRVGLTRSFVGFYKDNALIADIVNDICLFWTTLVVCNSFLIMPGGFSCTAFILRLYLTLNLEPAEEVCGG